MGTVAWTNADAAPLFLLGAVFGKLMQDSGAARVIASRIVDRLGTGRAVLAIVLACAVLTYGGVSLFAVAFAVYPIAVELLRAVDLPKLLPGLDSSHLAAALYGATRLDAVLGTWAIIAALATANLLLIALVVPGTAFGSF